MSGRDPLALRSRELRTPPTWLLRVGRPISRRLLRRRFVVRVHGAEHHPGGGPVIVAANHIGYADGPLMVIFGPRPVHALTKQEAFDGGMRHLLTAAGQIPLDRFATDVGAVRRCVQVLDAGRVVGIFPEGRRGTGDLVRFHRGAAYLALVTGAPVVPLTILGTRRPGGSAEVWPTRGDEVDLVYGRPYRLEAVPWPRTSDHVRDASLALRAHMRAELDRALARTGRTLPGPVLPGELDADPPTAVIDA